MLQERQLHLERVQTGHLLVHCFANHVLLRLVSCCQGGHILKSLLEAALVSLQAALLIRQLRELPGLA